MKSVMSPAWFYAACLSAVLALPAQAKEQPDFGRDAMFIAVDPSVEYVAREVLQQLPKKRLGKDPQLSKLEMKKGLKQFCLGVAPNYPDIVIVPREMDEAERLRCHERSPEVIKLKLGYEAMVVAASDRATPLSPGARELFLALASDVPRPNAPLPGTVTRNPYRNWSDLGLKAQHAIRIAGPDMSADTGRGGQQLAMEPGCRQWDWIAEMKYSQRNRRLYRAICYRARQDEHYLSLTGGARAVAEKLRKDSQLIGLMPYNDWLANRSGLQALAVDDIPPRQATISAGLYPLARTLYAYVKLDAVKSVPGVAYFLNALASDAALAENGYLQQAGLVPMTDKERKKQISQASELTVTAFQ